MLNWISYAVFNIKQKYFYINNGIYYQIQHFKQFADKLNLIKL